MYGLIGGSQESQRTPTGYRYDPSHDDKQQTILGIFMEDMVGTTETVIEDVLRLPTTAIRQTINFFNTHRLLIGMLLFSVFLNFLLSGRSTAGYWQQRQAEKVMQRIGIKPNAPAVRMVSLKEIDDLVASGLPGSNSTDDRLWFVLMRHHLTVVTTNLQKCTH
jgi:hypothetical protein